MDIAVFGAGCFWCVEALFLNEHGVNNVISGYTGGNTENPTYEEICTGKTGHAEVCKIIYDPKKISFQSLLEIFWKTHDPTTTNQQGNDIGTQYRSVIFYLDEKQKKISLNYKNQLIKNKIFDSPIVTEIEKLNIFYEAEDYHQKYYENNSNKPYCKFVIKQKIDKYLKNN